MISPIYREISTKLEQYIKEHGITGKLPGTRQLSKELGCHHVTISKAIHLLEDKGLLEIRGVRGVFVRTRNCPPRPLNHVLALVDSMQETPAGRDLLKKMNSFLKDRGFNMIGIRFDESLFQQNPRLLLNFPVDGFLFRYSSLRDIQANLLHEAGIPMVSCARKFGFDWLDQIDCDHEAGYRMLLKKLLDAGHRRIAWIEFDRVPDYRPYLEMVKGCFRSCLGEFFDPELMFVRETKSECCNREGGGCLRNYAERALQYFFSLSQPPTAIIVPGIGLCRELCNVLARMQLRMPEDISVMAIAHMRGSSGPDPKFAVPGLYYDEDRMLMWGIRRLLERLQDPEIGPEKILIPPVFVTSAVPSEETFQSF